jgi:cytochrome P450
VFIQDPWPHYANMRALGPMVWLPQHGNYAITRHAELRAALAGHRRFSSAQGVAGDQFGCDLLQGNTVASDPPCHRLLRRAIAPPLSSNALADARLLIDTAAEQLIDDLVARQSFDAIADLARHLPLAIVRDLVCLPEAGQNNMLKWAGAAFDVLGVKNARGQAALPHIAEMRSFIDGAITPECLKDGSWTQRILELEAEDKIASDLAPFVIRDYINPSLDTTISAYGQLIWRLAIHLDQWRLLQANPGLALAAANEAVRLSTPIRSFSRHVVETVTLGDVEIPGGARGILASAVSWPRERQLPRLRF